MKPLPPLEILRAALAYDPDTGEFLWKPRGSWRLDRNANCPAGTIDSIGYRYICVNQVRFLAHRLAWKMHFGKDPAGQIDHINGARDDNRIENLRVVTTTENRRNSAMSARNSSGALGVYFRSDRNKWAACIKVDRRNRYLGHFATKAAAIEARRKAEVEYGFHPNHGRRPSEALGG